MNATGPAQTIQGADAPAGYGALQRLIVEGIEIVRSAGLTNEPPVVLLHGIGSNARSFEPLMACLGQNRTLIAWNCPGYGRSAPLAAEWPLAQSYSEALAQLLDRLAVHRAVLVGHSLGAIIAARFAAMNPGRVAGVALISPAVGYRTPVGGPLPDNVRARIDDFVRLGAKDFAAARARGLVHEPDRKPEVTAKVEAAMAAVRLPGYAHAVHMLASASIFDDAAALQVPTVVVCGANDRVTPPEQTNRVAASVPARFRIGSDMILIEDAGHAVTQEQPHQVARHLAGLIGSEAGHRHG